MFSERELIGDLCFLHTENSQFPCYTNQLSGIWIN